MKIAAGRKAGPMSEARKLAAKEIFLTAYSNTHSIRKASEIANINRNTFAIWAKNGTITEADMTFMDSIFQDEVRDRLNYRTYDPWSALTTRQLRILAYRHLPEYRPRRFGETIINTSWWSEAECARHDRVVEENNAAAKERQRRHTQQVHAHKQEYT